ncbi:hypothetical protein ACN28S_56195 [Cystobacter fuscus]
MLVGLSVLAWLVWGALVGRYTAEYHVPVEVGGLYWHRWMCSGCSSIRCCTWWSEGRAPWRSTGGRASGVTWGYGECWWC